MDVASHSVDYVSVRTAGELAFGALPMRVRTCAHRGYGYPHLSVPYIREPTLHAPWGTQEIGALDSRQVVPVSSATAPNSLGSPSRAPRVGGQQAKTPGSSTERSMRGWDSALVSPTQPEMKERLRQLGRYAANGLDRFDMGGAPALPAPAEGGCRAACPREAWSARTSPIGAGSGQSCIRGSSGAITLAPRVARCARPRHASNGVLSSRLQPIGTTELCGAQLWLLQSCRRRSGGPVRRCRSCTYS
jgi:hypothetical protein